MRSSARVETEIHEEFKRIDSKVESRRGRNHNRRPTIRVSISAGGEVLRCQQV